MEGVLGVVVVIGFVAVVLTVAIIFTRRRRLAMQAFAQEYGFGFTSHASNHDRRYQGFRPFGRGRSRRSSNLVAGLRGDVEWEFFDYRYTTGSGKNRTTHHHCIIVARVGMNFDRLEIRPEHIFDKLAAKLGFDEIDFESDEFSRRFFVKSANRKRAYAIIHPRMMEYLLSLPKTDWQLGGPFVMIVLKAWASPEQFPDIMGRIEGFLERIPDFVKEDLGMQSEHHFVTADGDAARGVSDHAE